MRETLFTLPHNSPLSKQAQIRSMLMQAIFDGHLKPGEMIPSSRQLAQDLKISRNTIADAYTQLVAEGFLESRHRSGFFVHKNLDLSQYAPRHQVNSESQINYKQLFQVNPSATPVVLRPKNWQEYPYPFVYGQIDYTHFPINEWRECVRLAGLKQGMPHFTPDFYEEDDGLLLENIARRVLPKRGINVATDSIIITMGAQNALYLLARLFVGKETKVALEDPCYPEIRAIMGFYSDNIIPISINQHGIIVEAIHKPNIVIVTPSHQAPTTITMPIIERRKLLEKAHNENFIIIEDDYETEFNYTDSPTPALKSLDKNGRVFYVGSFSKNLFPGLRLGFIVAHPTVIQELRSLRRLVLRHPPLNNQRSAGLFLSLGYHELWLNRLKKIYQNRWFILKSAMAQYLPNFTITPSFGGTSFWVEIPENILSSVEFSSELLKNGVVIEHGKAFFYESNQGERFFRLGFSCIHEDNIVDGIKIIRDIADKMAVMPKNK